MPTKRVIDRTSVFAILSCVSWSVSVIFLLGVVNFALHQAVLRSGHRMLEQMPGLLSGWGRRLTLLAEFAVLLAAMALAANGWPQLAWLYAGYSALNVISAWLMLSGRI